MGVLSFSLCVLRDMLVTDKLYLQLQPGGRRRGQAAGGDSWLEVTRILVRLRAFRQTLLPT